MNGIKMFIRQEHNAQIHMLAAIVVAILGFVLKLSCLEWIAILIVIAMVFIAEILNTAIERLCDFIQPEHSQTIKEIKDLAARAVLISAMLAVAIGIILFLL